VLDAHSKCFRAGAHQDHPNSGHVREYTPFEVYAKALGVKPVLKAWMELN